MKETKSGSVILAMGIFFAFVIGGIAELADVIVHWNCECAGSSGADVSWAVAVVAFGLFLALRELGR